MVTLTKKELATRLEREAGVWKVVLPMLYYALKNVDITNDINAASRMVFALVRFANELRYQRVGAALKQGITDNLGLGMIGDIPATMVANSVAAIANRTIGLIFQGSSFIAESAILVPRGFEVEMELRNPDEKRGGRADILAYTETRESLQETKTTTGSAWKQTAWENGRKPHIMIATGRGPSEFAPGKVKKMDYAKQVPVSMDAVVAKRRGVLSFEEFLNGLLEETNRPKPLWKARA